MAQAHTTLMREREAARRAGGSGRFRTFLLDATLVAATLGVGAGVAEGVLRMFPEFLPETAAVRVQWAEVGAQERAARGTMIRPDPELGFRYAPDYRGTISRSDLSFTFTTDEHGFRNPGPWPESSEVVLVGDSMAFGYGVEDDEAWASRVRRELGGTGLINLGLPGMAPQQYLRTLEAYGLGLRPEVVLFSLFPGNDLGDAANFQSWLDSGRPGSFLDWGYRAQGTGISGMLERSYLFWLVRDAARVLGTRLESTTLELDEGPLQLAPSLYAGDAAELRDDAPAFSLVMSAVLEAQAKAREQGARLVVLLMPTKEHVYLPTIGEEPLQRIGRFEQALQQRGVETLDLTPALREAAQAGERVYFEIDGHPNRRGNELIASEVVRFLRTGPLASRSGG